MARSEAVTLVGLVVAAVGVGLWFPPAGLMVGGLFVAAWSAALWEEPE